MAYTAENWPITAALLQFPGTDAQGNHINDAEASAWAEVLTEVKDAGFANADLTDSWVRPGDLSSARLAEFKQTAATVGIGIPVISAIRRSVIEERNWEANLAYSHRTIDAAAELGCEVVSFGLHQALTPEQRKQLWFWTVEGHKDPVGDKETWGKAVTRLRELGRHAAEAGILLSLEMYEDTYLGHRGLLRAAGPGHRTGQCWPEPRPRQPDPASTARSRTGARWWPRPSRTPTTGT